MMKYHPHDKLSARISFLNEVDGNIEFRSVHFNIESKEITDEMIIDFKSGVIRQKRKLVDFETEDQHNPDDDGIYNESDLSKETTREEDGAWQEIVGMVPAVMEALEKLGIYIFVTVFWFIPRAYT